MKDSNYLSETSSLESKLIEDNQQQNKSLKEETTTTISPVIEKISLPPEEPTVRTPTSEADDDYSPTSQAAQSILDSLDEVLMNEEEKSAGKTSCARFF